MISLSMSLRHTARLTLVLTASWLVAAGGFRPASAQPASEAQPAAAPADAVVVRPEIFFGFPMGADGRLATWTDIERYFRRVADESPRVELASLGSTTEGQPYIAAIVSSPENIARLDQIRRNNLRLADPRTLGAAEARGLVERQPLVVAIGASIHATEIGATQAVNDLLYELATQETPAMRALLDSLVIVIVPSLNPDGHRLVVDWFEENRGTPFDAAPMPWLYHKYAGHDINRDAFMLNLVENRRLAQFFYRVWHPQVFLTMHQMGPRGPRFFVPPNYDPIDPNSDPLLWRAAGLLGHAMALQLERDGRAGVIQNALFDYYSPGYEDSAPLGHNTVCLLSEVASARLALPVEIKPGELAGTQRGLPDYRRQVNFPNPWPGGTWRLRDIVDYNLGAVRGLLDGASRYRQELLENFYVMGRRAVDAGEAGGPYAFLIPPDQHDPHSTAALVDLLIGGAVEVHQASEPFLANGRDYPAGTAVVLMAQPFRAYAKTLLERQEYPVRRLVPKGPPERPYDVAGWTLPLQMGVKVDAVPAAFELPVMSKLERAAIAPGRVFGENRPSYYLVDARGNSGALVINRLRAAGVPVSWTLEPVDALGVRYAAGTLVVSASATTRTLVPRLVRELGLTAVGARGKPPRPVAPVGTGRVGLYKPWVENIDEGWTRWLLEHYEFPYVSLFDADIRGGSLRERVDVIILPDAQPERLMTGHAPGTVPERYSGGLGREGVDALAAFVRTGGTLVCLDTSCGLIVDALGLPLKDAVAGLPAEQFFCPGSLVQVRLDPANPLSFGLPTETAAFFAMGSAYEPTQGPSGASVPAVRLVARYGSGNPLLSGWLEGPELMAEKGAALEARVGAGRVVLFGFRVQHRAQAHATFRLLFNALY
jgi:hypothetical protein